MPEMSGVATAVMAVLIIVSLASMEIIVFAVGGRSYRHPHPDRGADDANRRPATLGSVVPPRNGPVDWVGADVASREPAGPRKAARPPVDPAPSGQATDRATICG
jgi:hypothetical protein